MSGIVGMLVGSPVLSLPTADDESPLGPVPDRSGYRSPMRSWDARAAVRTAPRRLIEGREDTLYFSPDLVPATAHPTVRKLPPVLFRQLLVQHLYRYLDFTAKLESIVVNRAALGIATGAIEVGIPPEMRQDAYKIYCDEAYHTVMSVDLAHQVELVTGIPPQLPDCPSFLRRLGELADATPDRDRALMELVFVIVSETLISATLQEVPDHPDVAPAVREVIADHAIDEGRHHAFFAVFLKALWGRLTSEERLLVGLWVPRLIDAFLRPDIHALAAELAGYGLTADNVHEVIADVYPATVIQAHQARMSRQTLRYFTELGAFNSAECVHELHTYGLQRVTDT